VGTYNGSRMVKDHEPRATGALVQTSDESH
jgi:hypothetical protein